MKLTDFEIERDCDLRGYWVKGLGDLNKTARKALAHWDGEKTFIPDRLVRQLKECHKRFSNEIS